MRRNHILALLATGALPLSAFAAIEIPGVATDKGSWDLSGVSNVQTDADGMITVPGAQGGYPACIIENLPAGEYVISGDLVNAEFVVKLDGAEVAIEDGVFTTEKAGNLVIEVKAINMASSYQFGNITLALNVDLDQIQQELIDMMPTGDLTAPCDNMEAYVNAEDGITGTDVIAEYESLKDHTDLDALIAAVNPAGATPEEQLQAYFDYVNDNVKGQVEDYAAAVDAYENGVKNDDDEYTKYPIATINEWADTLADNITAHNDNVAQIDSKLADNPGWSKKLSDLEEKIAGTGHTEALTAEIQAVKDAIDAAKAAIEENWNAEGVQVGKADYEVVLMTSVKDAYDALESAYNQIVNDEDRYTNLWLPKYQELTNAYINAQQVIKGLYADERGGKERQDSVMAAVTAIYNDAVNSLDVKYGDGTCAEDEYTSDKQKIEDAIEALQARTDDDTANLAAEQAALEKGTGLVEGVTGSLDDVTINDDAYDKSKLETTKAALEAEAQALQDKIDGIYASTEVLTDEFITSDFQDEIDALQTKVDDFAAQVEVANQIGALDTALKEAKEEIANDEDNIFLKGLEEEYRIDVVDMMNGSYSSIQDAIDQQKGIYDEDYKNVDTASLDEILASINGDDDSYLQNGLKMAHDFAEAYRIALPDLQAANAFVKYIEETNPAFGVEITSTLEGAGYEKVNGVDQTEYSDKAKEYQTTAQAIVDALKAARDNTPQNASDAIEAVMADIETNNLAENIPATKIEFMKDVIGSTDGNFSNIEELDGALAYLAEEMADITDYAGYDAIETLYNTTNDALTAVKEAFNTAEDEEALDAVNADAKKIIEDLQNVQNEIDKVVKNYNAYMAVLDIIEEVEGMEDDAKTYADENSYEPARQTWKDLIDEKLADLADVKTALEEAYNAVEMLKAGEDGKTNEQTLTADANDIKGWFDGYENAVDKNELAHNALLDESAAVTGLVDEANKFIEAAEVPIILENGENAADVLKGYVDELSALDTELYNVYKDVSCEGQELDGSADDQTLMYKYEELRGKINDLRAELDDDYAKALKEYNEKFIADNWSEFRTDVMNVYTQAIINLDKYQDAVKNCAALAEDADIQDGVDHQPIYDFAPEIQTLLAEVTSMLETSWPSKIDGEDNANQRKLTEDDLADFIDRANDIIDSIGEIYSGKVTQITEAAEAVLSAKQDAVTTLISDSESELAAAGCDEESIAAAVKDAKETLELAEQMAQTPLDGPNQPEYVVSIGNAINELDKVNITDAQKTAAAQSTFDNAIEAVEEAIATAQTTLNESNLPESKKNEFQSQLNAATQELNTYKNDEITLENLKDELDKVNGIDVVTIQEAIDQAIADNQANNDNKTALEGKAGDLQDSFDALNDWVEQLLVAADVPMTTLQAKITAVQDAITAAYNAEELSDDTKVAEMEAQIAAVQAAIDQAYADAYKLEVNRLFEELNEANRAYNEAAKRYEEENGEAIYPDTTEGIEYTGKIDAQKAALEDAILIVGNVPTEEEQQAVLDIQNELLQIQIDLKYLDAADVVASLNEAAENAIKTINDSKDALGNYAAEKYGDDYDALVAEVKAIQSQWTEATAIVQEGVYLRDINEIVNDKLAALDAEAAAYQAEREANAEKEAASDAAYDTLNAELDAVRNTYNTIVGYTETYADHLTYDAAWLLNYMENWINADQEDLNAAKADYTCSDFEWTYALEDIEYYLGVANNNIWYNVTTNYQGEAKQAISNAQAALNTGTHPGTQAYQNAINALNRQLNNLKIVSNGDAEAGEAYIAAAKEIIEKAEALFNSIVNDEYTPGDVDGDGEISATDYEALIDLLGQIEDPTIFDNSAYDVNDDGQVTMADVASIIDILMGRTSNAAVMARMPMVNSNNAVFVVKTGVNNGVTRYAVMLNNTANLFAAQMDITLSDGMEIVSEGVAERTSNHEFYGSTTFSGKHRVILSSITKSTFVGSEGAVVYIDVRGEGELNVNNVLGVDAEGRMYNISVMSNVTGIESISNDAKNADIYNVGGQKLNRMERGVNIIRTEDGKASKVLNK